MSLPPALTAHELIAWLEKTSTNWNALIQTHPEILTLPCDIMGVTTVGGLLQHIVAVELRYAEQLSGLPPTGYESIPFDSAAAIYATHERAMKMLRELLVTNQDWDGKFEYVTRSMGPARSSRKTVLFHALMHGIRHYAQLATLVRQHGIKPGWPMDYLLMDMKNV
jgi:uncharacterized damage-inducible protein DinB